jgi:hypothetical protein
MRAFSMTIANSETVSHVDESTGEEQTNLAAEKG